MDVDQASLERSRLDAKLKRQTLLTGSALLLALVAIALPFLVQPSVVRTQRLVLLNAEGNQVGKFDHDGLKLDSGSASVYLHARNGEAKLTLRNTDSAFTSFEATSNRDRTTVHLAHSGVGESNAAGRGLRLYANRNASGVGGSAPGTNFVLDSRADKGLVLKLLSNRGSVIVLDSEMLGSEFAKANYKKEN